MGEGEVLSQGEVDELLRGVGDGEVATETDEGPDEETGVVPYDLTSQETVSYTHLTLPTILLV